MLTTMEVIHLTTTQLGVKGATCAQTEYVMFIITIKKLIQNIAQQAFWIFYP